MKTPTIHEVLEHVADFYGMGLTEAVKLLRTPTHPGGMRDDFAGRAMQSLLLVPDEDNGALDYSYEADALAKRAYEIADAMLEVRAK